MALGRGNLVEAKEWLSRAEKLRRKLAHPPFTAGGTAIGIRVALLENRPDDAEETLNSAFREFPALSHPFIRAGASAYRVHISDLRGEPACLGELSVLEHAYSVGRRSLVFDEVAAAYWIALHSVGRRKEADLRLREYLSARRARSPYVVELRRVLERASSL